MSDTIEFDHGCFVSVEEDCIHCGGTGIATIRFGMLQVVKGREEFSDAGFCSNCFGIGRAYWTVGKESGDEVMDAMRAACEEWMIPRKSEVLHRISSGERHEIRRT